MWFKVDDSLPTHHRVLEAGNAAMGLWVRCGAWSMGQLTDGFIPIQAARMFGSQEEIDALVRVGLWIVEDGGYQFHRWAEDASGAPRQPTRAEVEANRKRDRERKRDAIARLRGSGGRMESEQKPPVDPSGFPEDSGRIPDGIPAASAAPSDLPDPTRPDPTLTTSPTSDEVGEKRGKRAPRRTATRIPEDFAPDSTMLAWAAQAAPTVDVARATEKFRNHWTAKSGKDATKLDWAATWRNWILNEADYSKRGTGAVRESSLDRRDRQREQMFRDLDNLPTAGPFGAIGA